MRAVGVVFLLAVMGASCSKADSVSFVDRKGQPLRLGLSSKDPGKLKFKDSLTLEDGDCVELRVDLSGVPAEASTLLFSFAEDRVGAEPRLVERRFDMAALRLLAPSMETLIFSCSPASGVYSSITVSLSPSGLDVPDSKVSEKPRLLGGVIADPFLGWDESSGALRISEGAEPFSGKGQYGIRWRMPKDYDLRARYGALAYETLGKPAVGADEATVRLGSDQFHILRGEGAGKIPFSCLRGPDDSLVSVSWGEGTKAPTLFQTLPHEALPPRDSAISIDPGLILAYDVSAWRDARYEVFSWDRFPNILIFDTSDYEVQDRLFKRLAFFVEKEGFSGRLSKDSEIASLHGWNAHDYRAEDLASFFKVADATSFPLNREERELRSLLLARGVIVDGTTGMAPGSGAIVSISRESDDYLRSLFLVHECFHGVFFVDEGFRAFAAQRYDELPPWDKAFLAAYFKTRRYDTSNRYLMINETMAYLLQQPIQASARYFGQIIASRLDVSPTTKFVMPPKEDASLGWPDIGERFQEYAAQYDSYVRDRWSIGAGRIWQVYRDPRAIAR